MFDGILFDLDGTLWNSVPEVAKSWTLGLRELGIDRPPIIAEELLPCMGQLLPDIVDRLVPGLGPEEQERVIAHCCKVENEYLARHGAALYPGEEAVLAALGEKYPLFVVSNCEKGYIEAYFQGTGMGKYFTDFESAGRTGLTKAENIALVVERHGLKEPVYVGDTALDRRSATQAGVPFIHAAYGFGQVEGVPAIHRLGELPKLLETLGAQGAGPT